jgi:hypothetical protein
MIEGFIVQRLSVDVLLEHGKKLRDEDTQKGVKDRLNSAAYPMLGTYGVFAEDNRYGADFSDKIERTNEELENELITLVMGGGRS